MPLQICVMLADLLLLICSSSFRYVTLHTDAVAAKEAVAAGLSDRSAGRQACHVTRQAASRLPPA